MLIAVVALAVIVGSFLMRPDGEDRSDDTELGRDRATAAPSGSATTEALRRRTIRTADEPAAGGAPGAGEFGIPPGMRGSGKVHSLPPHKLTITITTPTAPLGHVVYIIPTSRDHDRGKAMVQGSSWSLTTTVYGNPKYATAFAQSGPRGVPVTCTITVDGKVTERRSTKGSFGAMWCLG